jgi:hypothetical protein
MSKTLNQAQMKCLEFYANGDFNHLSQIESESEFKKALADCDDTLFLFLMNELASSEDCDCMAEAIARVNSAIQDLQRVQDNLTFASADLPWDLAQAPASIPGPSQ